MSIVKAPEGQTIEDLKTAFAKAGITDYKPAYAQVAATVAQPLTDEQKQALTSTGYKIFEDVQFRPA